MSDSPSDTLPASDDRIPRRGRLLGIDYGTVRVGVAVSDTRQTLASPVENYRRVSRAADEQFFRRQSEENEIVGVIVGLPLHMSGEESEKSREARRYGRWLASVTQRPVTFQDERLSSAQADVLMSSADLTQKQRRARIDKLAAQIILQTWLDRRASAEPPSDQDEQRGRSW